MKKTSSLSATASVFTFVGACATTAPVAEVGPSQPKVLTEEQALLVIQEALVHEGARVEPNWPLKVGEQAELTADLRVGKEAFGIEWVSDEDRMTYAAVLPQSTPQGPLRIITGVSRDQRTAQILVLDANAYEYEANPQLVQRGAPSITEAEERVRRDVAEFLEYARATGTL